MIQELKKIVSSLKAEGIQKIIINFSGYSDSGDEFYIAEIYPQRNMKKALETEIFDLAASFIDRHMAGYENNEGGGGTVTIYADDGKMKLEGYYNEISESPESGEFDVDYHPYIKPILAKMKEIGIEKGVTEFRGYGDSGGIDNVYVYEGGKLKSCPDTTIDVIDETGSSIKISLKQAMEDVSYKIIDENMCGFEINDGGQGVITFMPETESANGKVSFKGCYFEQTSWNRPDVVISVNDKIDQA